MAYIKRGEAKTVPVRVKFNDMDVFPLGNVDEIAFKLGDSVRKTWPDAVRYDNANGRFLLTLTQEDTLSLDAGQAELEITCNFKGAGNILKPKKNPKIKVLECTDEELMECATESKPRASMCLEKR